MSRVVYRIYRGNICHDGSVTYHGSAYASLALEGHGFGLLSGVYLTRVMARAEGPPAKPGSHPGTKRLVAPVEVIPPLAQATGRNEQASRSRLMEVAHTAGSG